jgi:hypothetical protein
VKGLLIAALAALGALLLGMVKADLEDAKVCRWLARNLIYRATQCLPADERDRWREELIRDLLDLEGRVVPLGWALSVYLRAGRWGRERGVPSRWELLAVRVRLTWERLRSLTAKRSRARELNPASMSIQLQGDPAQVPPVAFGADLVARSVTRSTGRATLGYSPSIPFAQYRKGLPHLTDEEVVTLLSQSPQDFLAGLDRRVDEWRQERWRLLGREPE